MFRKFAILLALLVSSFSFSQDLLGAQKALEKITEKAGAPGTDAKLPKDIQAFSKVYRTLDASEAARRWTDLAIRASENKNSPYGDVMFPQVVSLLPPPESWEEISRRLTAASKGKEKSLPAISLRLIGHLLVGDEKAQWEDVNAIKPLAKASNQVSSYIQVFQELAIQQGDGAKVLEAVKMQISIATMATPQQGEQNRAVNIPDMNRFFGEAKAKAIYTDLLKAAKIDFIFPDGPAEILARKVVKENLPALKFPQYSLALSMEGADLYSLLEKRFPKAKSTYKTNAQGYFVAKAIYDGKGSTVMNQAGSLENVFSGYAGANGPLSYFNQPDKAKLLADYLDKTLATKPSLELWDSYVSISVLSHQGPRAITRLRAASANKALDSDLKERIRTSLVQLLLAEDKIDDALVLIRQQGANPGQRSTSFDAGLQLAQLGKLLNRPQLIEEGLKLTSAKNPNDQYSRNPQTLIDFLISIRRFGTAEQIVIDSVRSENSRYSYGGTNASAMKLLVDVYFASNRYADVVTLLDESPYWGVEDIVDFNNPYGYGMDDFVYKVAKSLAEVHRNDDALRVINAFLDDQPGFDPAYELFIQLSDSSKALARLDAIAAANPFEERPLIWKAYIYLGQNKLDEAEKTIKKAIAIDPSDGETTGGHRMFGYAVFAMIKKAQGKPDEAAVFDSAVKAIRMSEQADQLLSAGLYSRAVKLYADSLKVFEDAYCIQSRLAVQLAEAGNFEEAEEHYRRAFELMPESFGRMESHCFGCEGVFTTGPAANVAEKVFLDLVKKNPNKPQIHYLLGYLREEQMRYNEAANHYRKAVELDPDYINAWLHLKSMTAYVDFEPAEISKIEENIVRLDPFGKANRYESESIRSGDLKTIYRMLAKSLPEPKDASSLYKLRNSKAPDEESGFGSEIGLYRDMYNDSGQRRPGDFVMRNAVVQALRSWLMIGGYGRMMY